MMLYSIDMHDIALAIWFMLPVATANMMPIFAAAIPGLKSWNWPMDFGKHFRGKRIFGNHKTWRGLISGILAATLVVWLQQLLVHHAVLGTNKLDSFYLTWSPLLIGPLFGIGAIGGDAIESFFKRQRGVPSGESWIPFDQIDYIVGGLLVTLPLARLSLKQYVLIFIIWSAAHLVASYLGWRLGLKERPI